MSNKYEEEYSVTGGRDAFRNTDFMEEEMEERKIHAMKSFTESIDMDLPPMPELPPSLDIDKYDGFGMSLSSTQDTIIECKDSNKNSSTLGETQKYIMTVPGPGHTDQEQEQHKSLLKEEEEDVGSPEIVVRPVSLDNSNTVNFDSELRKEYSKSIKTRPRPTTPIQTSVLESFIANCGNEEDNKDDKKFIDKITVKLPKKDNDPFVSSKILSKKPRSYSKSQEGDILSDNEEFKSKAPAHPVVHRRASIEWENFAAEKDNIEASKNEEKNEEYSNTSYTEGGFNITQTDDGYNITYSEDGQYYLADDGEWYPVSALYYEPSNEEINAYETNIQEANIQDIAVNERNEIGNDTYTEGDYYAGEITYSEDGQYYLADDGQWYPVTALENVYYSNEEPYTYDTTQEQYSYNAHQDEYTYDTTQEQYHNNQEEYSYDNNYSYNNQDDYTQYGAPPTINQEEHSVVLKPLFSKQEIGSVEKDPYAWDGEEVKEVIKEEINEESKEKIEEEIKSKGPPPRPTTGPILSTPSRPPPPTNKIKKDEPKDNDNKEEIRKKIEKEDDKDDAWARFNAMSSQISSIVKDTEEKLKDLSSRSAADEIKDETYLASVGGSQANINLTTHKKIMEMKEKEEKEKADKKLKAHLGVKSDKTKKKKKGSDLFEYEYDVNEEEEMDRKAAELAEKLGSMRQDVGEWKKPEILEKKEKVEEEKEDIKIKNNWTGFDDNGSTLPLSDSDFFNNIPKTVGSVIKEIEDPFAGTSTTLGNKSVFDDPFDVPDAESVIKELETKVEEKMAGHTGELDYFDSHHLTIDKRSNASTPTQEGGSPVSGIRPIGFDDEFSAGDVYYSHTPTPLFDDDDSIALTPFRDETLCRGIKDGWSMMIRHPLKKKLMADRVWKPCYVKLERESLSLNKDEHMMLKIFNAKTDGTPVLSILLQPTYSLSDGSVQPYDAYGKIHTVKLQQITYKEKVGIRQGQISRLVEGHLTKFGMPIEHSATVNVLAKFASLEHEVLDDFINTIEDILFRCECKRNTKPIHKQDEVQIHCYDEYIGTVDLDGCLKSQKARVRMFCLAFLTGSPTLEIGLNDRRRQGKEIVRRKDILPMYTERWIKFENIEFHSSIDQAVFVDEHYLKVSPPDGVFFEIMRFRVRPPKNKEKPLTVKSIMKIAGSGIEIRIEAMAAASTHKHRNRDEETRIIPCEDIQIRFPIPEAWIYLFREERSWGVGSVHSKTRRPGKVKNLKDKIMGAVTQTTSSMIEVAIGEAKYEHLYRSLVWRIPRLPEKHHEAYKNHLLTCRFELSSFDLMPEAFMPDVEVEFTMPLSTVSSTVVRSIGVEGHEDSDRVEKFVRYVSKYNYKFEIDYFHCDSLQCERAYETVAMIPNVEEKINEEVDEYEKKFENNDGTSSESEEEEKKVVPMIQINMKGYELRSQLFNDDEIPVMEGYGNNDGPVGA
uniref:SH3 domain-containing protein n=1 Tax=Parastrongyloides trichosuri TaxID=131310 RepID=A0A0N4ZP88_PARTI